MDLNTVEAFTRPKSRDGLMGWREGDAWLAGGTWLFSEPQPHVRRLIDLESLGWTPLEATDQGLTIAATCRIFDLHEFAAPPDWSAAPLIPQCCNAFLMSFKIWNAATVGGNVCMSLPAGAMVSLTTALEGVCLLWDQRGGERRLPVEQFVTGNHMNALQPGEILRSIHLPASAMRKKTAFRQASLTHYGRSAALLAGTLDQGTGEFNLMVSAATVRPLRFAFAAVPSALDLHNRLNDEIPDDLYLDDVHGSPPYRKHMTYHFGEQIRQELAQGAAR